MKKCLHRSTALALLILVISASSPFADMTTEVKIICDSSADLLIIVYDAPIPYDKVTNKAIIKTYNLYDFVTYKSDSYLDKIKMIKYNCKLKTKNFIIHIEPYLYNNNAMGECGADITCSVAIKEGPRNIVQEKYLELSCPPGNSFKKINQILISGKDSRVEIKRAAKDDVNNE
ncbi:MAG: hypothetical protein C4550_01490 [Nitrospiraceae bacterium]|nr:MAG: hypothetical protein C4550_01490 [Nitrospiraceae bacterium]